MGKTAKSNLHSSHSTINLFNKVAMPLTNIKNKLL